MRAVEEGTAWYFVILRDGRAAGTVCLWESRWEGEPVSEIGWMVLPELQGRGIATDGVRAILERARSDPRWNGIHAFPGVTNAASNAICRKTGFAKLEDCDIEYMGRGLRCSHWRLDAGGDR